jgi:hypothetical protein
LGDPKKVMLVKPGWPPAPPAVCNLHDLHLTLKYLSRLSVISGYNKALMAAVVISDYDKAIITAAAADDGRQPQLLG